MIEYECMIWTTNKRMSFDNDFMLKQLSINDVFVKDRTLYKVKSRSFSQTDEDLLKCRIFVERIFDYDEENNYEDYC